jgi:phosphoribosylaminoimidazole-succinocarboxamide synthase
MDTDRTPDYQGKVRDVYDNGDGTLLFVASDRLSVFDVVLNETVPDKGRVLTALTHFWLTEVLADVCPSHLVSVIEEGPFAGRGMVVKKAEMLPIECVVRGHLSGSAWKEYKAGGTMHGTPLPAGLRQSERLPEPVFTPSTKAEIGDHDENISFERAAELCGADVAAEARRISLEVYRVGAAWAAERGITIADTKFELGFIDGELALCDEILTPDSSRFWPSDGWAPGEVPPSLDKQPVRDFLDATDWDKTPPPPPLNPGVVAATTARYREAYERLTGRSLDTWPG